MSNDSSASEIVVLASYPEAHASRSGYQLLAEYLPQTTIIRAARKDPHSFFLLTCARIARKLAFSRWYLGGSGVLEWRCLGHVKGKGPTLVHYFWADFDMGFLDYFLRTRQDKIIGTFHHCSDTLGAVIRFPNRLRQFAAIILMSATQRPFMVAAGVKPERIHVIHHGVDTEYFVTQASRKQERFQVLTVGGYRRDFTRLHQVCAALRDYTDVVVRVIGPKAMAPSFAGLSNVEYSYGLNDGQLLEAYQHASCFLMLVENATANNALLEAMACGLPVIADQLGGIPEYVNPACALFLRTGQVEEAVKAIKALRSSTSLGKEMGSAARSRAEELDWRRVARATSELYQQLLN